MTITCLNCGGSGYLSRLGGGGLYYPYKCGACQGSGKQTVRGTT